MRPVMLKFAGLRSYREEQTIDFTDIDLMAIVGDTGAGKSSVLEALVFALYGGSTWNGKGGKGLIADGGDGTLRVELTFRVKGKTWRVTRTTSVNGSPPSNHHLLCVDDCIEINNARPVDAKIRDLIGMDYSAFLKAVVLPQGRFQELLHTSGADRALILKTVLGLDALTSVRDQAKAEYDRLHPLLTELDIRRRSALPDPWDAEQSAIRRLTSAHTQHENYRNAQHAVTDADNACTDATARAGALRSTADYIAGKIPADTAARYRKLIDLDTDLTGQLAAAQDQLEEAETTEQELTDVLDAADAAGTGVATMASVVTTMASLLDHLPGLADEQRQLADDQTALEEERKALQLRKTNHDTLVANASEAETTADNTQKRYEQAVESLGRSRTLLAAARSAHAAVEATASAADKARQTAAQRAAEVGQAEIGSAQADQDAEAAHSAFDTASQLNAVAHAAEHSGPGDLCPICTRTLPEDFTAPTSPDLAQAKAQRTRAARQARTARDTLTTAIEAEKTAKNAAQEAQEQARGALSHRAEAIAAIQQVLGQVDLAHDDATLLADITRTVQHSDGDRKTARTHANNAHSAVTRDITEINSIEAALTSRSKSLAAAKEKLQRRLTNLTRSIATLPEPFRLDEDLNPLTIATVKGRAEDRCEELTKFADQRKAAQVTSKRVRGKRDGVAKLVRTAIEEPVQGLATAMQALTAAVEAAAPICGPCALPLRPQPPKATTDATWASQTLRAVDQYLKRCRTEASAQETTATAAQATLNRLLTEAGVTTVDELNGAMVQAAADKRVAEGERDEARAQQPVCAELDRRIAATRPLVESLRELAGLLADGKFMAAVVRRRQRALLEIASDLLLQMTKDRFFFAEDFRIVDGQTGQPRDVKTLSGGETFLASLTLALALVKLTSRGGGQVEALFLDEGFGSLDANALAEALDALTRQATGGRLVAVISHMKAVAENFDHVLLVNRTTSGSHAHWTTPAERDQLVTDELTAGLLN